MCHTKGKCTWARKLRMLLSAWLTTVLQLQIINLANLELTVTCSRLVECLLTKTGALFLRSYANRHSCAGFLLARFWGDCSGQRGAGIRSLDCVVGPAQMDNVCPLLILIAQCEPE